MTYTVSGGALNSTQTKPKDSLQLQFQMQLFYYAQPLSI